MRDWRGKRYRGNDAAGERGWRGNDGGGKGSSVCGTGGGTMEPENGAGRKTTAGVRVSSVCVGGKCGVCQ